MLKPAALTLALAMTAGAALAQPPAPPAANIRVQGVVTAVSPASVTIKDKDGKDTILPLAVSWTAVKTRPVDIEAIKPGSFVATANTNIDEKSGKSIELRIFEPGNKGGEGSRPMAAANTTMTNGTVQTVKKGAGGRELDVSYPGGVRHIVVPPDVQVIGAFPVGREELKPGVSVTAVAAKGADGVARVARVQIAEK
jgi:hypothetical protein